MGRYKGQERLGIVLDCHETIQSVHNLKNLKSFRKNGHRNKNLIFTVKKWLHFKQSDLNK